MNKKQELGIFITPGLTYSELSKAYWSAAESIFDSIVENHHLAKKDNQGLVSWALSTENSSKMFPAFYLYRHSVELMIKETLALANEAVKSKPPKNTHALDELFKKLLIVTKEHCDERVYAALNSSQAAVNRINAIDKRGTKFRYPGDNQPHESHCVLKIKEDYDEIHIAIEQAKSNFIAITDYQSN
ncbi:MAG: hypothetical protein HOI11_14465 [Gammaproteobacteria bacterium]|jgi:hypothetical protein|nr:hypothetical protein [Gammaproteobacteria bacterium]